MRELTGRWSGGPPASLDGSPCHAGGTRLPGKGLSGVPVVVREVDRIDFDPDDGVAPAPGLGHEFYSIRWTGQVDVTRAGNSDLMTNADDGIRVLVDGRQLLTDWSDHAPRTKVETVSLVKGRHQVIVEYFQGTLGAIAQFGFGPSLDGNDQFGGEELERIAGEADAVVLCLGYGQTAASNSLSRPFKGFWPPTWAREADLVESEDSDRRSELPEAQLATLRRVSKKNPHTVVIVNAGGGVGVDGWLKDVRGLIGAFYPGQEGGRAIAETLFGLQNPSAKLPFTMARRYEDHPSARYYDLNEGGKTPYVEGLLTGYRGFDVAGIEPAFPFGFGLSYTTFVYGVPSFSNSPMATLPQASPSRTPGAKRGTKLPRYTFCLPQGWIVRSRSSRGSRVRVLLQVPSSGLRLRWRRGPSPLGTMGGRSPRGTTRLLSEGHRGIAN